MARPEWVEVGRISRAHGVHGESRVSPDSDNPDRFMPGSVVYARRERAGKAKGWEGVRLPLTITSVRGDAAFPIVAFQEITDRDGAEGLRDCVLEVPADQLPELDDNEFYPFDLAGLEVRDEQGGVRGQVADVLDTPAHPLLSVLLTAPSQALETDGDRPPSQAQAREILVPFVEEAVPVVDLAGGFLTVASRFLEQP